MKVERNVGLLPPLPVRYEIDSNFPLPDSITRKGKYPFDDMNPGDSFAFPPSKLACCSSAVSSYKKSEKNKDKQFVIKTIDKQNETRGARCWRIK